MDGKNGLSRTGTLSQSRAIRLLVGQPTRGALPVEHLECLDEMGRVCEREEGLLPMRISRIIGCSLIDHARSIIATKFLEEDDSDVLVWIDDDMIFDPSEVVRMARESLELGALVGAPASMKKMGGSLNFQLPEGTHRVGFFREGGRLPVRTIGTGILAGPRSAYERVAGMMRELHGPITDGKGKTLHPLFCPMLHRGLYWGEDSSFCIRAGQAGVPVYVDTRVRVLHLGKHLFGIEETAQETVRHERLYLNLSQPDVGSATQPRAPFAPRAT